MQVQLLVAALEADTKLLTNKLNIGSDCVIVNQCNEEKKEVTEHKGYRLTLISDTDRGVGRNRNLAIDNRYTDSDIVLFGDEDITYEEGYAGRIIKAFEANPKADIILFNVRVCDERRTYWNEGVKKLSFYNVGRYPAYSIAIRNSSLTNSKIRYSILFGGGAKYSNGEDSVFLMDALRCGLKIYTSPEIIGEEEKRESTWFKGYNEKFFFDRGVLFAFLYGPWATLWALRFVLTKKEMFKGPIGRKDAYKLIRDGIKQGKAERNR